MESQSSNTFLQSSSVICMSWSNHIATLSGLITVPTGLSIPIPIDYVNYVNLCYADPNGILHPLYPLQGLSGNPTELPIIDGATGIPTQSSYDTNLEASQSIIEDRWKNDIFQKSDCSIQNWFSISFYLVI